MLEIKVGHRYVYEPSFVDRVDPRTETKPDDRVIVIELRGFGHCDIATTDGKPLGMVLMDSLLPEESNPST